MCTPQDGKISRFDELKQKQPRNILTFVRRAVLRLDRAAQVSLSNQVSDTPQQCSQCLRSARCGGLGIGIATCCEESCTSG